MKIQANYDDNQNGLKQTGERFWEIDFFRGIAIILMLGLHLIDDLYFFKDYQVGIGLSLWLVWQRITATIFLLLVGISLALKREKLCLQPIEQRDIFPKFLRRGIVIFGWGVLITIVTKIFLKEGQVDFGVLHLIGVSMIIGYPFLYLKVWNLLLGTGLIGMGIYLQQFRFSFPWLLWVGLTPKRYFSVDYFPVLPWFGVILIGIFLGQILYRRNKRRFPLYDLSGWKFIKGLCFLGKHSLIIYLVHQPLFVLIISTICGRR